MARRARLPEPFFVIATQNPVEQIGAYPLPESQLDRFLMAIELGYPDPAAERELLTGGDRRAQIATLPPLADPPTLLEWQREAADVHVAPALLDYVQALLAATRGNVGSGADAGARRGLSPRAGLLLLAAARAWALLAGRPMVAARGRAGGVPVGRRASARRRRARRRTAGAVTAARRRAALTTRRPRALCALRPAMPQASRHRQSDARRRTGLGARGYRQRLFRTQPADHEPSCCAIAGSTSCRRAAASRCSGRSR